MYLDDLRLILVPTDFSEPSVMALRTAIRFAQTFQAGIEILHVNIDPALMAPPPSGMLTVPLDLNDLTVATAERLDRAADEVRRAGVPCATASEAGRTHTEIVDHARYVGAGMIVMGTHCRHGLSHALLGSVAEKVVQHAPCPVLVVPPPSAPVVKPIKTSFDQPAQHH